MTQSRSTHDTVSMPTLAAGATVAAGVTAGAAASTVMLVVLAVAAASERTATAVADVETSLVTVPNAITNFVFDTGVEQFHQDYSWPTFPGVGLFLAAGVMCALVGAVAIAGLLGPRPDWAAAAFFGLLFGVFLQVVVLGLVVDGLQDTNVLHSAAPGWAWWVGHLMFGLTTAVIAAAVLRRATGSMDAFADRS